MEKSVGVFRFKHELTDHERSLVSTLRMDDICFFRYVGGSSIETASLIEQLYTLKEKKVLLIGVFRFPFRFEGKKRLQAAIVQYHHMKEICDAVIYFHSDGMLDILKPGTSIQQANMTFNSLEEVPLQGLEEMIRNPGEMNIDVQDIQAFVRNKKGPLFIHTFEGDTFDQPLKDAISTPYLPHDYADGEQLIVHIGYTRDVDMDAYRHINLRLNDLFHKADLFKLGTHFIDEPGHHFKITLLVNGIQDPFTRPEHMNKTLYQRHWINRKWSTFIHKNKKVNWFPLLWKQREDLSDHQLNRNKGKLSTTK